MERPDSQLSRFLESISETRWLKNAGEPHPTALVVADAATGFDGWNAEMLATWSPRSQELEQLARRTHGDEWIDDVFERVSTAIDEPVRAALQNWFDRRPNINQNTETGADLGLWPELLETIKRDIAWAAVEELLSLPGFFSVLLGLYRDGRWRCSWEGQYPGGRPVIL